MLCSTAYKGQASESLWCLVDAFDAIRVNVHELMGFEERLDLRPQASEQGVKFLAPQVSKSEMNHPGWRSTQDNPF
jgi:hypothetical protein